ncbi:MAG: PIN domain-containing protein [Bacteroidales bacterium]|nr:PIN domain-containing protein [Bacteroidales bacterium]
MSIILDTSIWIEYFKGNDKYFDICQQFIEKGEVKTIEIIFAELLQGARNKREIEMIKDYFELLPKVETEHLYLLAGEYAQKEKLISKGIGLIDACIITASITSGSKLWTLDKKITAFLNEQYLFENH